MAKIFNRRRCLRLPVKLPVVVSSYQGQTIGVMMRDLSMRGCALETAKCIREGARVRVQLRIPGEEPGITVETAVVRAVATPHMGLEFLDITSSEKDRLGRLVFQLWKAESQSITRGREMVRPLSERVH